MLVWPTEADISLSQSTITQEWAKHSWLADLRSICSRCFGTSSLQSNDSSRFSLKSSLSKFFKVSSPFKLRILLASYNKEQKQKFLSRYKSLHICNFIQDPANLEISGRLNFAIKGILLNEILWFQKQSRINEQKLINPLLTKSQCIWNWWKENKKDLHMGHEILILKINQRITEINFHQIKQVNKSNKSKIIVLQIC